MNQQGVAAPTLVLMMALVVLVLGGVSVDLWRVLAEHRRLAGAVDAAAVVAATAIDEKALRTGGVVMLDPDAAQERACVYLEDNSEVRCPGPGVLIEIDASVVTVEARHPVELALLGRLLGSGSDAIEVAAAANAEVLRGEAG